MNTEKTLLICLIIGTFLRFYQLGHDSFWNDEAGVALVAQEETLNYLFQAARGHVMAMPLDYVLIWALRHFSFSEFVLRIPATIFGVATLVVGFNLFKLVFGARLAKIGLILLTLSPLLVHYSQEMRFYASMLFFYLLSTYTLLIAIERPTLRNWIKFMVSTILGAYFHVFVLLSIVNGVLWLVYQKDKFQWDREAWVKAVISLGIVGGTFLPGYIYFGWRQAFDFSLLQWSNSIWEEIGIGLGWIRLPYVPGKTTGVFWYVACFGCALIGVFHGLKDNAFNVRVFTASTILQLLIILGADLYKGYWFSYRQALLLHPFALAFAGMGILRIENWMQGHLFRQISKFNWEFILVAILFLGSLPALRDYYRWPKSNAREISNTIVQNWEAGDVISVSPGYNEKIFRYYLQYPIGHPEIASRVRAEEVDSNHPNGIRFVVIVDQLPDDVIKNLLSNGYQPVILPETGEWLGQSLYLKEE